MFFLDADRPKTDQALDNTNDNTKKYLTARLDTTA
jgi:hypothetical protein